MDYINVAGLATGIVSVVASIAAIAIVLDNRRQFILDEEEEAMPKSVRGGEGERVRGMVRQAARYAVAAQQDESAAIRALHANYATAYLNAALGAYTTGEIEAAMGTVQMSGNAGGAPFSVEAFRSEVLETQDWAARSLVETCPALFAGLDADTAYLAAVAGHG